MSFDELRTYCLSKPATTESLPFDETTLVFKVAGKMFALSDIESRPMRVSLKCDPERAVLLRDEHAAIEGAFHMNKRTRRRFSPTSPLNSLATRANRPKRAVYALFLGACN